MRYALLSEKQYKALNLAISKAKGYPDDSDTERYAPEEPERDINNLCVMPITAEVQINFVDLLANLTLYETYICTD